MKLFVKISAGLLAMALLCSCMGVQKPMSTLPPDAGLPAGTTAQSLMAVPMDLHFDPLSAVSLMPKKPLEDMVSQMSTGAVSDIDLAIPGTFAITRPADKLTTSYAKYFITGTSNPERPVYFGDSEITRLGTKGTFGVLVDLQMGANSFTFRQGDKSKTVTITRKNFAAPESVPITKITQASMIPAYYSGVKVGEDLEVGCVAPSGASVTATFGGQSVTLKQISQTAKAGVPAHFLGSITVSGNYASDVTGNGGKVKYKLSYNGATSSYTSTGDVYVAGENSRVAVRVTSYMGFVYPDTKDVSKFREKIKQGGADYIVSQDNTYAQLASGGFVLKEQSEIVTGKVAVGNKLSGVTSSANNKSESFVFAGTRSPVYLTKNGAEAFSITLYNTSGTPAVSAASSKIFSGVTAVDNGSSVTYTFTKSNAGKFWGYNVAYNGTKTIVTFRYRPALGSGDQPFKGMTIVIDPGHGGTDVGALGVAGKTGPAESAVNLAHAYATRDLLASMGANVVLTRGEDIYYSLDNRLLSPEQVKADFFISLHHNSIGENADANTIAGMEVYYHTALSKKFANSMMSALTLDLNRTNRFVEQSYYRVTLSPYCPAILVELGYMSNPLEYERAANTKQINKVAAAIADGIKQTLSA